MCPFVVNVREDMMSKKYVEMHFDGCICISGPLRHFDESLGKWVNCGAFLTPNGTVQLLRKREEADTDLFTAGQTKDGRK